MFGTDLRERLESAGFRVTVEDAANLGARAGEKYGLQPNEAPLRNDLYRCER
ncbi:MAG: hypothetical protein ACJ76I_13610 [Gaiellaceae bacterium]